MSIAVRLPKELEDELARVAHETHRTKSFYIRLAIEQFLEDRQDYFDAMARLEEKNPRVPYDKIRKKHKLDD